MIDLEKFRSTWAHLCTRFGRDNDPQQAAAYFEYLTEQLDTEEFLRAARAIWATARWFPRPADFLTVGATGDWQLVLDAAAAYNPPDASWFEHWKKLSPRGVAAAKQLGGITAMRSIYDRDVLRLRTAFLEAFEAAAAHQVLTTALPSADVRRLTPA